MRRLSLLALPLFAACVVTPLAGDTTFTRTNRPTRPMRARALDSVEVFTSSTPSRGYTEVGLIRSTGGDVERAMTGMRQKAAAVGCDGVVVTSTGTGQYNQIIYNGACFLYAEDTTWAPPASGPDSVGCESQLAELRAAPNDSKPAIVQRIPPECLAAREP
jgi:hypothetical protein